MPSQHTTAETTPSKAMLVPLDLDEMHIVSQACLADGTIRVEVMATATQATCPQCHHTCAKIHDTRPRKNVIEPCEGIGSSWFCSNAAFAICGVAKPLPNAIRRVAGDARPPRLREAIGKQAYNQPVAHAAKAAGVGPRFVEGCFHAVALQALERQGRGLDEQQPLATSSFLGIDEFARRKGHRYDTILCDLEARRVLEVSARRTIAIGSICVYAFYSQMPHELFANFPRKDGEPSGISH